MKNKALAQVCAMILTAVLLAGCGNGAAESAGSASVAAESAREAESGLSGEAEKESGDASESGPGLSEGAALSDGAAQMDELDGALKPQYLTDKYRTGYEVFVGSFYDSNGDGIGDLKGLTGKLDYINDGDSSTTDDLEAEEIWTMPVFPSPTYHKYDATDYESIDPDYGTMEDFETYVAEAHKRGIKVVLDMAFNHTSTEHPWFESAEEYLRNLPENEEPSETDCPYISYYNFSKEKQDGYEALAGTDWYYEARFWSGMPDLNLDSEAVRTEISEILAFWLGKGVDGFRLDAVTSYYTDSKEKNIEFLSWLNGVVKEINPDAYLVGECWEGQSVYADYYKSGIDSFFDFDFAAQEGIIASVARGTKKASTFAERMAEEETLYSEKSRTAINAPFYTNHDIARSCGYYAKYNEDRVKLAGAMNLLMTGHAYIYYGEELGMSGSGKDENKRAPMQWVTTSRWYKDNSEDKAAAPEDAGSGADSSGESMSKEAETVSPEESVSEKKGSEEDSSKESASETASTDGMCDGPEDMDDFGMKYPGLDRQSGDMGSIFNYFRNALRIRNSFPVIARGRTEVAEDLTGDSVCAFVRTMDESTYLENAGSEAVSDTDGFEPVLVVMNTSDEAAKVDLGNSAPEYRTLAAVLNTGEDAIELDGSTLVIPAFGIAVLTQ